MSFNPIQLIRTGSTDGLGLPLCWFGLVILEFMVGIMYSYYITRDFPYLS